MPSRQAPQSPTRPSTRRRAGTTPKPPPSPTAAGPRSRLPRAVSRDEADIAARLEALSLVKPDGDATAASKTTARPAPKLLPRPVPTQKGARDASTLAKGVRKLTVSTRPAPPPATVKKASPSRIIPKPPAAGPSTAAITPAEQVTTAMRNVNASLTALAELKAAGFKAPAKQGDANAGKVRTALEQGGAALTVLRRLVGQGKLAPEGGLLKGKELDVERAALAIAAKLLEMDLHDEALQLLARGHGHLCAVYFAAGVTTAPTTRPPPLSYPVPPSFTADPQILSAVPLVITATVQTFTAYIKSPLPVRSPARALASSVKGKAPVTKVGPVTEKAKALTTALVGPASLARWATALREADAPELAQKATLGMRSVYSMIMKLCVEWEKDLDAKALLHLKRAAITALVRIQDASSDKLDTLFDHSRASVLVFARASGSDNPAQHADVALESRAFFDSVTGALPSPAPDHLYGKSGSALCELVLALARRVDDFETVSLVNSMLPSPGDDDVVNDVALSPAQKIDALDAQITRLLSRIAGAASSLDRFLQKGDVPDVASEMKQCSIWIRSVGSVRSKAVELSPDAREAEDRKMWAGLERARRLCVRALRRGKDDAKGKARADVDVDPQVEATVSDACRAVARAVVEVTLASTTAEDDVLSNIVDTLLCLADSGFEPDDAACRDSSFADLETCRRLVETRFEAVASPADRDIILVRCVSSGYYNLGVALYNSDLASTSLRFLGPSCDLPTRLLLLDRWAPEDEAGELEDLRKQLVRRWELVALAHLSLDKQRAHEAYVSAILAHPSSVFRRCADACANAPLAVALASEAGLAKLVQRGTRLAVCDLLSPDRASLATSLRDANVPTEVIGMLVELQVAQLSPLARKEECRAAAGRLLQDLLEIYSAGRFPIRRARVLVRLMEHRIGTGATDSLGDIAAEVEDLCDAHASDDAGLRQYAPQFKAFSHLWLGLAAQQAGHHEAMVRQMRSVVRSLRPIATSLPSPSRAISAPGGRVSGGLSQSLSSSKPQSPLAAKVVSAKSRASGKAFATPRRGRKLPLSKAVPARTLSKQDPSTPSPKKTPTRPATMPASTATGTLLDDWERQTQHLFLVSHILRAQGQTSLRVAITRILLRFLHHVADVGDSVSAPKAAASAVCAAVELAHDFLALGKADRASTLLDQAEPRLGTVREANADVAARFALCRSLCVTLAGDFDEAHRIYQDAKLAMEGEDEAMPQSSTERVLLRTRKLHRSASAASTYSALRLAQGDLRGALAGATQALRLLDRASSNLRRVASAAIPSAPPDGVIEDRPDRDLKAPLLEVPADLSPRPLTLDAHPTGEMTWQVAATLVDALRLVVSLFLVRGSPRIADGYMRQLSNLCSQLAAPRNAIQSLVMQADISALSGDYAAALARTQEAGALVDIEPSVEGVHVGRAAADLMWYQRHLDDAMASATSTQKLISKLGSVFAAGDEPIATPRKPLRPSLAAKVVASPARDPAEIVLPSVGAHLVRLKVRIAQGVSGSATLQSELARLNKTSLGGLDRALELSLVASIRLGEVRQRLKSDPLLGLLNEALVSLPYSAPATSRRPTNAEHLALLDEGLAMARSAIAGLKGAGDVAAVRELMHTFASLRSLQYVLGRMSATGPGEIAAALDFGASVTVERELLEAAHLKTLPQGPTDDLVWPSNDDDVRIPSTNPSKAFWRNVEESHQLMASDPTAYRPLAGLPPSWRVVSLHLALDQDALILVRHTRSTPVVFHLPLDRHGRREGDEDLFTFEAAAEELRSIVTATNESTHRAQHVTEHQAKALWWAQRRELNARMEALVNTVENRWLGSCKGILRGSVDGQAIAEIKPKVEKVLFRHLMSPQDRQANRVRLDDAAVAAFAGLPRDCPDEDLEDLLHFAIDMLQLAGAAVVCDEVDADQVVCDLRDVQKGLSSAVDDDGHLFLCLDKHLQAFPWEMIPVLSGRSVSRIPNLAFLRDRLCLPTSWSVGSGSVADGQLVVDASRTSWVINPGGDLVRTEEVFGEWLEGRAGWTGIRGRAPSSEEIRHDLHSSDLFLYFGHGGAEQYIRSQSIRQLQRCSVAMLWGCSSGELRNLGVFDPFGTPNTYLLGGCPSLLANLWDVTDKDIDRLAQNVFRRTGLDDREDGPATGRPVSLGKALAEARSTCRLKYLNGAAPVIYGLPCSFAWSAAP